MLHMFLHLRNALVADLIAFVAEKACCAPKKTLPMLPFGEVIAAWTSCECTMSLCIHIAPPVPTATSAGGSHTKHLAVRHCCENRLPGSTDDAAAPNLLVNLHYTRIVMFTVSLALRECCRPETCNFQCASTTVV